MKLIFKDNVAEQGTKAEFCLFLSNEQVEDLSVYAVQRAAKIEGVDVAAGSLLKVLETQKIYILDETATEFVELN